MNEAANEKLNNIPLPIESTYIKIPRGLRRFSMGAQLIGGLLYSFSGGKDDDGCTITCRKKQADMGKQLVLSSATVCRRLKDLTQGGFVSKTARSEYVFNRETVVPSDFDRLELDMLKANAETGFRLAGIAGRIFSHFYTLCNNDKKLDNHRAERLRKKHKVQLSYSDIAKAVGCSGAGAIYAVKKLIDEGYIHRAEKDVGISAKHKSIYELDKAYWRRMKRKNVADSKPEPAKEPATADVLRREVELGIYRDLKAQLRADSDYERYKRRALYDPKYKEAITMVAEFGYKRALERDEAKRAEYELNLTQWGKRRIEALHALGLAEYMLDPKELYIRYAMSGAPPGKGAKNNVGELNTKN